MNTRWLLRITALVIFLILPGWVMGDTTPPAAAEQSLELPAIESTISQPLSADALFTTAGSFCSEGAPAIYVTCDPVDISDDIQNAVNTLKLLGGGTIYLPECDAQFLTTIGSSPQAEMPGGINIIG